MNFLDKVRLQKEAEIAVLKSGPAPTRDPDNGVRPFGEALRGSEGIIAEVKGTSPSRPDFQNRAAPAELAACYERGGAVALSVVTDRANFGTSLNDLAAMRGAVSLAVISKDFICDEVQIRAAWAAGADAVLLIARLLAPAQLAEFIQVTHGLGMDALVECHDEKDLDKSLSAGARIVGINNRDLATLTTDLGHTARLLPRVPRGVIRISESGLTRRSDIQRFAVQGVDAFLVGHALLLSGDPGRKLRELNGRETEGAVRVKICGLTSAQDAALCHEEGADLLGAIFAPSPRQVDRERCRAIRAAVPTARLVGVFADAEPAVIAHLAHDCGLDLVQLHGHETPEYCRELFARTGLPLIKALTPEGVEATTVRAYETVKYFLLDQPKTEAGPAQAGDQGWRAAATFLAAQGAELILAGGLDARAANGFTGAVRPFGLDICRAVEAAPGRKDPRRVRRFFQEVIR